MPNRKRPLVVVTRKLPDIVETRMRELFDARLNLEDKPMSHADLAEAARVADVLVPTITDHIDAAVLGQSGEKLKLIANFGNGVDNIDVATALQRGITVTNTPGVLVTVMPRCTAVATSMLSTPLPKLAINLSLSPDWLSTEASMRSVIVGTSTSAILAASARSAWLIGLSSRLRRASNSSHMRVSTLSGSLRVTTTNGLFRFGIVDALWRSARKSASA